MFKTDCSFTYLLIGHRYFLICLRFFFHNYNKENTAHVTGQQRVLTRPWYLILPLSFVEVRVTFATVMHFPFGRFILLFAITTFPMINLYESGKETSFPI